MNDDQISPQSIAGVSGLPLPAGTDDNGNPFWMIDGRKVLWAEMQQYIWQEQQKQKPAVTSGGGVEGLSQVIMPNIEAQLVAQPNPEVAPQLENRMETASERGIEQKAENRAERGMEQQSQAAQTAQTQPTTHTQQKAPSLLGDSPVLTQVDTSSPTSIVSYVDSHHKDAPDNSSRFLSELLEKIVKVFSLEH